MESLQRYLRYWSVRVHQTHFLLETDTSQRVGEAGLVVKHVQRHFHVCDIMLKNISTILILNLLYNKLIKLQLTSY